MTGQTLAALIVNFARLKRETLQISTSVAKRACERAALAKELSDGDWAICVFNPSKASATLELKWSDLPFLKGTYAVHDVWSKRDAGDTTANFSGEITSHDVALLRLHPQTVQ